MQVQFLYFARVREKTGLGEEYLQLPEGIETVAQLLAWQQTRSRRHGEAFAEPDTIRVALDQQHASLQSPVAGVREFAFFPPVTGG